jgi:hypothetical protein
MQVIPPGWGAHHRAVVAGSWNGAVTITGAPPGTSHWDDDLEQNVADPGPTVYNGPARVQALAGQGRTVVLADDTEVLVDYLVVVPHDVPAVAGHRLVVTDGHDDPLLEAQPLTVRQVVMGTERFERDLMCTITS